MTYFVNVEILDKEFFPVLYGQRSNAGTASLSIQGIKEKEAVTYKQSQLGMSIVLP
jgi:hypothetical protein